MSAPRLIRVLANSQALLLCLAEQGPMTPAAIASRTGIPRSSVYRLGEGLAAVGMVEIRDDATLALADRWLTLADRAANAFDIGSAGEVVLNELAEKTGQTVYLSVRHHGAAMCVRWAPGSAVSMMLLKPGRSLPLHVGAAGRLILAFDPDGAASLPGELKRFTPCTLTSRAQLDADSAEIRSRGYSLSDEDVTSGIGAIGAPVWVDGSLGAVLSVAGLADEIRARADEIAAAAVDAADSLSGSMSQRSQGADLSAVEA
ncbi:IclR family transcriptional regulator [Microbacterium sp. NPDC058342]|uniref:IclR family transcriptional regulator n=1 Tax=Microbacterium sp. NPDC058342 TaxID=3346454 RepID=UPI003669C58D